MAPIKLRMLKRKEQLCNRAGPPILRLGVYDMAAEFEGPDCFELRGEDEEGRLHFSFRDPSRMTVLDEFDLTLNELESQYDHMELSQLSQA